MEDIEVIYELEKQLGIKSREIAQEDWEKRDPNGNNNFYVMNSRKIDKISIASSKLKYSISTLFDFLPQLTSLTDLDLSLNKIEDIPESITRLSNLTYLKLSGTDLKKIPEPIFRLTTLIRLEVAYNELKEISTSIENLTSLRFLDLKWNKLKEIPESIFKLSSLTHLDLYNNYLNEFPEAIIKLTSLTQLNIGKNRLKKISEKFIELASLEYLGLAWNQLEEIPESMSKLTSLSSLDLHINKIQELPSSIVKLVRLKELNLSNNKLSEIPETINKLTALVYLNLSDNHFKEIPDVVSELNSLIELDFSQNQIREIPKSISKLPYLTNLKLSDNRFKEIPDVVSELNSLIELDFSQNQIHEIPESISDLFSLKSLDLSENQICKIPESIYNLVSLENLRLQSNKIEAIPKIVTNLTSLAHLDLSNNQIKNILQIRQFLNVPSLKVLSLSENPLPIPMEILDKINCLQDLRNYFQDRDNHGWSENDELKIILIGNGGTGKSSLMNRLVHNKFDETYKSTHGIQLSQYKDLQPYTINIWDFAGQDIYHATHRLFMQTRALFLILWDNETENQEYSTVNENGKKRDYKNYKLDYWLNYVKVLGKGSRALIIQSKSIRDEKKVPPNTQELKDIYKNVWIDNPISIDSKEDSWIRNGYKQLLLAIENAIEETNLLGKEQLPNNWVVSRDKFYKLLDKEVKKISYEDFTTMCEGKESVNPDTVLHWLVDSGVVFYKEGLFNNQIIIDQQWAINAVYTLFDRKKHYYQLKDQKGKFTNEDLREFWKEYSLSEQKLFLSYMLSCEICYKTDNVYIAPALLPDERPKILNSLWEGKESYFIKYKMLFFHYGTMQSFLVRLGNMQLDAITIEEQWVWQYGISFKYKENTFALVEAKPDDRQIIVRVSGQDAKSLLDKIRNLIEEIQGKEGISESFSKDGEIFFDEKDKEKYSEMKKFFEKDEEDKFERLNKTIEKFGEKIDETNILVKENLIVSKDTRAGVDLLLEFSSSFSKITKDFSLTAEERFKRLEALIDRLYQDNETDIRPNYTDKLLNGTFTFSKGEFKGVPIPFKADVLEKNSLEMLACGLFMYEKIGDSNQDKAPIIIEFCRIIENELSMKVFNGYKNHLLEKFLIANDDDKSIININLIGYNLYFPQIPKEESFASIVNNFASQIKVRISEQMMNETKWKELKETNNHFTLEKMEYGLKLLENSSLHHIEFIKEFKQYVFGKFNWKEISDFNLRENLLKQDENLFYIIFEGGNRNPKYSEMLFGKRSLKEIYRNPAGHTGIFTDLTTNKKTEYCMNMVLAFLKVWVSAIRVS
ncbi:MAG TPA: leucine-rich repeat domain-containing protein [Leptospiraceae bacterium]|nr:leucine-rich repeat domain-containing protein [Leptospiraceae bacterium]